METKEKKTPKKDNWEYKDRSYYLLGNKTPLTYTIMSKHTDNAPMNTITKYPYKNHTRGRTAKINCIP